MAASKWVIDATSDTFQSAVIDRSHELPVVVDFWAPWCGPCRALGPVLEKLAAEQNGGFLLAKVNTDEHPDLAQAFQVSGIPAVFGIRDGKLVNRFEGVLPEDEVRKFLETLAPTETENALEAAKQTESRDPKAALASYRQLFADNPDDPAVRVGLARALLAADGSEDEIHALLAPVDSGEHADEAERLKAIIAIRGVPHSDADLAKASGSTADALLQRGRVLAARGEYLPAMDVLLQAAEDDKKLGGTDVKELMVRIFHIIGARSPEADDYRGRLRNLLY
ncbi:MAG: tetratricopeptide repeat protein [Gemmataceae bacterium]